MSAIETLGRSQRLTIGVGAGASKESGLPLWDELVERLLRRVGQRQRLPKGDLARFTARVRRHEGLLGAATVARHAQGRNFESELRRALYAHPDDRRSTTTRSSWPHAPSGSGGAAPDMAQ